MSVLRAAADAALALFCALLLAVLVVVVAIGVLSRGLGSPVAWSDELARYLLVWLGFAGTMLAARRRAHIRIEVFIDRLPARARRAAEIAIQVMVGAFGLALAWWGAGLIGRNLDVEAISLPVPQALLYLPLPLAGIVLAIQAAADAMRR
ncbi:MAG: TRAP transporter small permease subunit [Acetobacteraceae bacterium]|nr:TRAP transporter small permease subunit [Acetobacteraceae bacterium]